MNSDRKKTYRKKHSKVALCTECPEPIWNGGKMCMYHTLNRRLREKNQSSKESRYAKKNQRRSSIWDTPI